MKTLSHPTVGVQMDRSEEPEEGSRVEVIQPLPPNLGRRFDIRNLIKGGIANPHSFRWSAEPSGICSVFGPFRSARSPVRRQAVG